MAYHPFSHLGLKIVSILLAVLLWLTVAREPIVERTVRVPLQFQNIPDQLEIVGDPPASADVRVRGSSGVVSRVEAGEIVAVLDLRGARPGTRLFHLVAEDVRVPFGLTVAQVLPSTVPLEFERAASRVIPVVPAIEGEPAPGYVVGPVSADPATVEVVGPESHVGDLIQATTEPVSVAGATETVRDVVTIGVTDSTVRIKEARNATVEVAITSAPVERTLQEIPVKVLNLGSRLAAELTPMQVDVNLRGTRAALGQLSPQAITAFVDVAGLGPGRYTLPVRVEPPEDVGLMGISPSAIQVRIK
jgi:YbbR domain-containing protein